MFYVVLFVFNCVQVLGAFRAMPMKGPDGRVAAQQAAAAKQPQDTASPNSAPTTTPSQHAAASGSTNHGTRPTAPAVAAAGSSNAEIAPPDKATKAKQPPSLQYTASGAQVPVGNGGVGPDGSYVWTQTLQDCTVHIPVPPSCTGKRVQGAFKSTSVELHVRDVPGASLSGELGGDVVPDECLYTLDRDSSSCTLTVTFEKRTETWWRSVIKGHPEIDASLVDSTRHVSEYDDETQATIRKLVVSSRPPAAARQASSAATLYFAGGATRKAHGGG